MSWLTVFITCSLYSTPTVQPPTQPDTIQQWLIHELTEIERADQKYRNYSGPLTRIKGDSMMLYKELQIDLDRKNQQRIVSILDTYGYPSSDVVGEDLVNIPCLVVHHSNPAFMEKYIPMMVEAAQQGKIESPLVIALINRHHIMTTGKAIFNSGRSTIPVDSTINGDSIRDLFQTREEP